MRLISCFNNLGSFTFGDIQFQVNVVKMLVSTGIIKSSSKDSIDDYYSGKITADVSMHPFFIKIEIDSPEDHGVEAVIVEVIADYHDTTISRFRNEGAREFFKEQLLIKIDSVCGSGTGISDAELKGPIQFEYLRVRKAILKSQEIE